MDVISIIIFYLSMINLTGFAVMGLDKYKAKKHAWRIPESTLFIISIIGGAVGTILGMYVFRHKTRKRHFVFGLPAILIVQVAIFLIIMNSSIQIQIM